MAERKNAPKKFTETELAQVEALGSVLSMEQIADYFGIGRTTIYRRIEAQPEIMEHYKRGKAKAIGSVAKGLLQQAQGGNLTAMMFYLKTQAGWRETANIDLGNRDDKPLRITMETVKPLTTIKIDIDPDTTED